MKCSCGTEFSLEPYHDDGEYRHTTCHSCYRNLCKPFDCVSLDTELTGFNWPYGIDICTAQKNDILMVVKWDFQRQKYLLVGGGFQFWAAKKDVHKVSASAIRFVKTQYESITGGEWILKNIQKELAEMEKDPKIKKLLEKQ